LKRSPGVAAVEALPELAVGEAGEEATVGGEECVGHRRQRLREPARERLPGFAVAPPVDVRLRIAAMYNFTNRLAMATNMLPNEEYSGLAR